MARERGLRLTSEAVTEASRGLLVINGGKSLPPADEQRRLRVLLVDTQDLIHWGFKMLLAAEPWVERFVAAHNATHALELARRYHPHVAVIDMQLGRESGADVCEQIRASVPETRV